MKYIWKKRILNRAEYDRMFSDIGTKKLEIALNNALDIRKFEIELYWKRGRYFWTFIALTFTSYFLILNTEAKRNGLYPELKDQVLFMLNLLGIYLSIAWLLVNKGSKYWQENWEKHVDLLEDKIMGPLYKTTVARGKFWDRFRPTKSYPYSVGKINQLISLAIVLIWIFILYVFCITKLIFDLGAWNSNYSIIIYGFIALMIPLLFSSNSSEVNGDNINMNQRQVE